jgi:outer membrane protein OmpA-like peptidoglycan-associated protein
MSSWGAIVIGAFGLFLLAIPSVLVSSWIGEAEERLEVSESAVSDAPAVATASAAHEDYCTPELQRILRRVLQSCGLVSEGGGRGCQPVQARQVATMRGEDFNALFIPMAENAGIIQFDRDSADLDAQDRQLVEQVFADRGGASWFFVVSRASPEGSVQHNRELSRERAEAVMAHLTQTFQDPDLERQVGLLWLGEEYAQLEENFCDWRRSGGPGQCRSEELNRSAFVAWIECRL